MDLLKLNEKTYAILHQQDVDGSLLVVKENEDYRWFEYGGQAIQSIMDKAVPESVISPVSQALLVFLLFNNHSLRVLNLGLGGASFERSLSAIPRLSITSVEASRSIIDIAQRFFQLPIGSDVVCERAEDYVQHAQSQFDVVICDLFIGNKSPDFLFTQDFYVQLNSICSDAAVLMINVQVEKEEQLLSMLVLVKQYFPFIALIDFDDYKNIVVVCSSNELPDIDNLQARLVNYSEVNFSCLDDVIKRMRYVPKID